MNKDRPWICDFSFVKILGTEGLLKKNFFLFYFYKQSFTALGRIKIFTFHQIVNSLSTSHMTFSAFFLFFFFCSVIYYSWSMLSS